MSGTILSFRELTAYQLSFEMQQQVFTVTKDFPKEERYALTDQIRRSSRSVGANIAEAWQKRRYLAHFVSKLTDADGELAETRHWIETAFASGYISEQSKTDLIEKSIRIGRMLGKIIGSPEKFCPEKP